MSLIYDCDLPDPQTVYLRDPAWSIVEWAGRRALRLSGQGACLLVVPDLSLEYGRIEVDISSAGAAYPGLVFHLLDSLNYELAYAQPHTSGSWDSLQYDPVFHGSNTWQLYHGLAYQKTAELPLGAWFHLCLSFQAERAMIQVGDQEPLVISRLAQPQTRGLTGLWSYLPAYFANLRIWDDLPEFPDPKFLPLPAPVPAGTLTEWFLDGYGVVSTEPSGILNLNRYLPVSVTEARLTRSILMRSDAQLTFNLGFSDQLSLQMDDELIFSGQNTWHDTPRWSERGYVTPQHTVTQRLTRGAHLLSARLQASEAFGFGLSMSIAGDGWELAPAHAVG